MPFSPISVYTVYPFMRANYIADNVIDIPPTLLFGEGMRNRFGHGNEHSIIDWSDKEYHIVHRYSEDAPLRSFEDIMDERAQHFKDMAGNDGKYLVSYSGGVDSTALVCALIRNGINPKNIRAVGTMNSPKENPAFVSFMESNGIKYDFTDDALTWKNIRSSTADIILNGNCADQLFGSVVFVAKPEMFDAPSRVAFRSLMVPNDQVVFPHEEKLQFAHDWCVNYAKETFNVEIVNGSTMMWFLNYVMKWEYVAHTHQASVFEPDDQSAAMRDFTFFDTDEFSKWSVLHYPTVRERNFFKDSRLYKKELKDYIYTVFKDKDYWENKDKQTSRAISPESRMNNTRLTLYLGDNTFKRIIIPRAGYRNKFALSLTRKPVE